MNGLGENAQLGARGARRRGLEHRQARGKALGKSDALSDRLWQHGKRLIGEGGAHVAADRGVGDAPVDDERGAQALAIGLRLDDETHGVVGRPDVDGRGLRRDQHEVGGQNGRARDLVGARRSVDDDYVVASGKTRQVLVQRSLGHADNGELRLGGAHGGPRERTALRIGIDEKHAMFAGREGVGEVDGKRRLADAALLIEQRDNHKHRRLNFMNPVSQTLRQSANAQCRLPTDTTL